MWLTLGGEAEDDRKDRKVQQETEEYLGGT